MAKAVPQAPAPSMAICMGRAAWQQRLYWAVAAACCSSHWRKAARGAAAAAQSLNGRLQTIARGGVETFADLLKAGF